MLIHLQIITILIVSDNSKTNEGGNIIKPTGKTKSRNLQQNFARDKYRIGIRMGNSWMEW